MTTSPYLCKHDLHVHLFGCLDAEDVWTLGKNRWQQQTDLLQWYEDEYEKAWGRRPNSQAYWLSDNGFELLKNDFVFSKPGEFAKFQACFNLLIALFKIKPEDPSVLKYVIEKHQNEGLEFVEYRTILPHWFKPKDVDTYLRGLAQTIETYETTNTSSFKARLAFTLMRDNEIFLKQYNMLRSWMDANQDHAKFFTAIDLAYYEEDHPPNEKKAIFETIREENKTNAHPLKILYHVGESFEKISLMSSIRWVWQAHQLGADRLGHAISLAVNPDYLLGSQIEEPLSEYLNHLDWLIEHQEWLSAQGFSISLQHLKRERSKLKSRPHQQAHLINYDQEYLQQVKCFQQVILKDLSRKKAIVESCPSSNLLIAKIPSVEDHPLKKFLASNLKVCLASDDPGVFATSLYKEEQKCRQEFKLSDAEINSMAQCARDIALEYR